MTILKAILLTFLFVIIFSIFQIGFSSIFYKTDIIPENFQNHIGIINVISFILTYLLLFKIYLKPKLNLKESLNFKNFKLIQIFFIFLIVIGLQLIDRPFWDLEKLWNYLNNSEFEYDFNSFKEFNPAFFYRSITILIISPICEELFFRQVLLIKLMNRYSQKISILISSFCFAIIHIETPFNLIPTFIFGIISSIIFIKTNKIGYSIILHFLMNLFGHTLYVFNHPLDRWLEGLNYNFVYWIMFLIGIVTAYFGLEKLLPTRGYK
jgi:membrane protease YdiL (CAAX protease family)